MQKGNRDLLFAGQHVQVESNLNKSLKMSSSAYYANILTSFLFSSRIP